MLAVFSKTLTHYPVLSCNEDRWRLGEAFSPRCCHFLLPGPSRDMIRFHMYNRAPAYVEINYVEYDEDDLLNPHSYQV